MPETARSLMVACFAHGHHQQTVDATTALFKGMFGGELDNVNTYLRPFGPQGILSTAFAQRGDLEYRVSVQEYRIDFSVAQKPTRPGLFPVINDVAGFVAKIPSRWSGLPEIPGVTRLSLVVDYAEKFASNSEAALAMGEQLNNDLNLPDDVTDFALQMNQPMATSVDGVNMVRFQKWVIEMVQEFQFIGQAGMAPPADLGKPINTFYVTSHLLDINNVPTAQPIPSMHQRTLISEIVSESLRLRTAGGTKW